MSDGTLHGVPDVLKELVLDALTRQFVDGEEGAVGDAMELLDISSLVQQNIPQIFHSVSLILQCTVYSLHLFT